MSCFTNFLTRAKLSSEFLSKSRLSLFLRLVLEATSGRCQVGSCWVFWVEVSTSVDLSTRQVHRSSALPDPPSAPGTSLKGRTPVWGIWAPTWLGPSCLTFLSLQVSDSWALVQVRPGPGGMGERRHHPHP